ncbi:hypothetical protein CEN39_12435 [Fischerella thermalis CCMEE 5201]|jgi:hypothetical protein|nr:hypothetical protein CEN39_12435 [Fischerella thermalis CCMEE 5201]
MTNNMSPNNVCESTRNHQTVEISLLLANLKNNIWFWGIFSWMFGVTDRGVAAFADGYLSPVEILQICAISFLFLSWLFLKPDESLNDNEGVSSSEQTDLSHYRHDALSTVRDRMLELQKQHMISQAYTLPFPYLCQIYHLLNLKHLETVHSFSLNNLKVVDVNYVQATNNGGVLKFQTILAVSGINILRIWRRPIVEVDLILHTPFTVELSIPVYNNKRIIVIFNALPLSSNAHKFFVDIYSDLEWPKPVMQIILHFASCLTLYEDLPYLRALAKRNIDRLFNLNRISKHETMWLFRRFVELYGSSIEPADKLKLLSSREDK